MYDQPEYPESHCACGEHLCRDCIHNEDGNPENCLEYECFAGAICRFKKHPDF